MKAVLPQTDPSHPTPRLGTLPTPTPAPGEILLRVTASALNRVDLMQIRGQYPPPPGESEIPGLEASGVIEALGEGVPEGSGDGEWHVGQRVAALLAGGGHAEFVAVPVGQLIPVPAGMDLVEAGGLPEVAITAWTNLVAEGGLREGESVLISGAASGVGTFSVQLARELGARVLVAGRTRERLEQLRELGADEVVVLGEDLPEAVREANEGRGVDLVMDLVGGHHLPRHLKALDRRGRLVLVGLMAGTRAEVDLRQVLSRRLRVIGSVLRSRSRAEKAELVAAFRAFADERLADGRLKPVIDRTYPLEEVAEAYRALEEGGLLGKVVLTRPGGPA